MKVYIVFEYDYENTEIIKIFKDKKKAKQLSNLLNKECKDREFGVERYEVELR